MDKYYHYSNRITHQIFTATVFILLLFDVTSETKRSNKRKGAAAASSAGVSFDKRMVRECFADFLVLQYGERTKIRGKGNKTYFVTEPLLVDREKLAKFMRVNQDKTAELWNCVNNVQPFPHNERVSSSDDGNDNSSSERLAELLDIFRMQITKMDAIVPSLHVQEKLHNPQCLSNLGIIEGKFLEPIVQAQYFQELSDPSKHSIVISAKGAEYLKKCLREGKPFFAELAKREGDGKDLLLLNTIGHRGEMVKFYKLSPVPNSLLKSGAFDLNYRQKQCFVDFFVVFGTVTKMRGQRFVVEQRAFPARDSINGMLLAEGTESERQAFVKCLKAASFFPDFATISNAKFVDYLVKRFYDQNYADPIALSPAMQRKMHNVQCWLDLGVLEGKINLQQHIHQMVNHGYSGEATPWLAELYRLFERPIVVSPAGAVHMGQCLYKGAPFESKLEEQKQTQQHQWHLQLLHANEENDLQKFIKQPSFSEWLHKEIANERNCMANFLVRHWHARTIILHWNYQNSPTKLGRKIVWNEDEQQRGWPSKVHAKGKGFGVLKSCLFRKAAFLKFDATLNEQYIDLKPLFLQQQVYTAPLLTQQLNIQSDCLANFLAIKSGDGKCLVKKKRSPTGGPFKNSPFWAYAFRFVISSGLSGYQGLSAEQCHLPEGETGIYRKDSVDSKEREEFKQLWDCGVPMTTEEGGMAINVRALLKIHTPKQLYLRGNSLENQSPFSILHTVFPSRIVTEEHEKEEECPICLENYKKNEVTMTLPACNHKFHSDCIQKWIGHDSCPKCRAPILKAPEINHNEATTAPEDLIYEGEGTDEEEGNNAEEGTEESSVGEEVTDYEEEIDDHF